MTLEAVLIYFKVQKTDWPSAKKVMSDNFMSKLKDYEVDKISEATLK